MSLSVANICCFLPTNLISDNLGITLSNLRSFAEIEHIGSWQSLFSSVTIRHFETTAIQYSWLNKKKTKFTFYLLCAYEMRLHYSLDSTKKYCKNCFFITRLTQSRILKVDSNLIIHFKKKQIGFLIVAHCWTKNFLALIHFFL